MAIFGAGTRLTYFSLPARTLSPAPLGAELAGRAPREAGLAGPGSATFGRGSPGGPAGLQPPRPRRAFGAPAPRSPPAGTRPEAPEPGEKEGP